MSQTSGVGRLCVLVVALAGCGLEGPIINAAIRDKSTELPTAADNVVLGAVAGVPAGAALKVLAYNGAGTLIDGIDPRCRHVDAGGATVEDPGACADGSFALHFPGNSDNAGVRLEARWSTGQVLGILPNAPKQLSVVDPERIIRLDEAVPALQPMSPRTTAFTLIILGSALNQGKTLAAVPEDVLRQTSAALDELAGQGASKVAAFVTMVDGLLADVGGHDGKLPFTGTLQNGARPRDLLDAAYVAVTGPTAEAFEAALLAAAGEIQVAVCYAQDHDPGAPHHRLIRVVLQADLRTGLKDHNCQPVDTFKWATNVAGKVVYLAAGLHKTTPQCSGDVVKPWCVDQVEFDAANATMGNWVPNQVAMYDDGTHGDAVKGDSIWSLALDLPYVPVDGSPTGAGVRLGYKFTYGQPGQGWTDSEEWPGNQRLLELVDVNGDGLVVRLDAFGDESGNKDKANALTPANGGCGTNFWENEIHAKCAHDTREAQVDTDGDCLPDAWPSPGPVSPLTVPCGE